MKKKNSKYMDTEYAKKLLNEAKNLGVEVVDLTGGEPSLHPHFSTIMEHALSLGFKQLNICTNGYALDINMLRKFDPTNIHFFISMDGTSKEVIRKIRGSNIDKLTELFGELNQLKLKFSLRFCLNAQNWMETADMLSLANELGVDIAFEPTQIIGNAGKDLVLSREQALNVADIIHNFKRANISIEESFSAPFPCDGGQPNLLSVDADGKGSVCLMLGTNEQVVPDNTTLKEIWDTLQVFKKRMKNFRPIMEHCNNCPYHPLCLSGCHVTAYTQGCFNPWKEEN